MGVPGFSLEEAERPREDAIDDEFEHLMTWYADIRNRQARGQKWEPIELQAILAYEHFLSKLGIQMTAFDWDMLFRLDAVWTASIPKSDEEIKAEQAAARRTRH